MQGCEDDADCHAGYFYEPEQYCASSSRRAPLFLRRFFWFVSFVWILYEPEQ